MVGPIDWYPTILDALKLPQPKGHVMDGESVLPILEQRGKLNRTKYLTWFPHLIPATSVRQSDFKLIRRFELHRLYPETVELYNLKEDIGETKNLTTKMPEKVQELQGVIDPFIKETGALSSNTNPKFDPKAAARRQITETDSWSGPKPCSLVPPKGTSLWF